MVLDYTRDVENELARLAKAAAKQEKPAVSVALAKLKQLGEAGHWLPGVVVRMIGLAGDEGKSVARWYGRYVDWWHEHLISWADEDELEERALDVDELELDLEGKDEEL